MALGVLVLGAVAASALSIRSMTDKLQSAAPPSSSEVTVWPKEEQVNKTEEKVPVLPQQSSSSSSAPSSAGSSSEPPALQSGSATGAAAQTSTFILPAAGQVTAVYSGDELVYNETLADWRTHNGLDITAPAGTQVVAAMDGTVTRIEEDALWGTVVEVESAGRTLRYCGLAADVKVGEGALVKQGDPLGNLGSIPAESALEPHLHFEVEENGSLIDPEVLMK